MAITFSQLPTENLLAILRYLDIPDLLRIRRVSRYLNEISQWRDAWSDAYRKADFVHPPGPLLSQSACDLENALVPSFRVGRNFRYGGITIPPRKLREIRYTGTALGTSLVFGRFLLVALKEEVRCYDLNLDAFDSNSGASIIHRSPGGTLISFHCVSAFDVGGHPFACAVLSEELKAEDETQVSIYLLNVTEQSEITLDLVHQSEYRVFDILSVDLGPRVIVVRGSVGPSRFRDLCTVALDVHARTQFLLPPPTDATWETDSIPEWVDPPPFGCISTSTYLLLARSTSSLLAGPRTIFQAFALPLSNSPVDRAVNLAHAITLPPTHYGVIPEISADGLTLLHDAILDPTTQGIIITVRVLCVVPHPHSTYGVLHLEQHPPASPPNELGTITFRLLGLLGSASLPQVQFAHPSFNGTGRVFFSPAYSAGQTIAALEYDVRDVRERAMWNRVEEYPTILLCPARRTLVDYDPYSGLLCLQWAMKRYWVIEILDLAV